MRTSPFTNEKNILSPPFPNITKDFLQTLSAKPDQPPGTTVA